MRINVKGKDGSKASFQIEEDGRVTLLQSSDPSLESVRDEAEDAAAGPPLWTGPLEYVRQWADTLGHDVQEIDVLELPSVEGRVY